MAFAFLTPLFFVKGGMTCHSLPFGRISASSRSCSRRNCSPSSAAYIRWRDGIALPHAGFTTLLMATGLTFGTISSLYGLQAKIITQTQFSLLIAVVVLSAIVPTVIAQTFLQPEGASRSR